MIWTALDTWIVVIALLSACSCALLGNFLVLRRMSMMGDAISHAVLPGIAAAFILSGRRDSLAMLVGAVLAGLLTAFLTRLFSRWGKVEESASMGVVFTSLFAFGLILISRGADAVDLDPDCVLYGALELAPLDVVGFLGWQVPRAVLLLSGVLAINAILVFFLFKEFKISAFDEGLAEALGYRPRLMHNVLMAMVAVTAVASFESVGSIIVIAMFIVPPSAAFLMANRLGYMIALSLVFAVLSAFGGHVGALTIPAWFGFSDTITSGMMTVAAGLLFIMVHLVAPREGLLSRWLSRLRLYLRTVQEDILGLLYRLEELGPEVTAVADGALLKKSLRVAPWHLGLARWRLKYRGAVVRGRQGGLLLTDEGRVRATRLVRSHRLWETYLYRHLAIPADHVHKTAEKLEHITSPIMQERLADDVQAEVDPQGKSIPEG